jgi:hypothetical protein
MGLKRDHEDSMLAETNVVRAPVPRQPDRGRTLGYLPRSAGRGSTPQDVLHLRGNVSGWPRTRLGKGVRSDKERPTSFELLGSSLLLGNSVNNAATPPNIVSGTDNQRVLEPLTPDGGSLEGGGRPASSAFVIASITTPRQWLNTIPLHFREFIYF